MCVQLVFLLGFLALQAANRQANERKWGGVVVIKNIPGYPGCSLVTLEGEQPGTWRPVFLLFLTLHLLYALLLQTLSLLLRPLPAGPEFSVDPPCSHLVKLRHSWRLGSEVGENCL